MPTIRTPTIAAARSPMRTSTINAARSITWAFEDGSVQGLSGGANKDIYQNCGVLTVRQQIPNRLATVLKFRPQISASTSRLELWLSSVSTCPVKRRHKCDAGHTFARIFSFKSVSRKPSTALTLCFIGIYQSWKPNLDRSGTTNLT